MMNKKNKNNDDVDAMDDKLSTVSLIQQQMNSYITYLSQKLSGSFETVEIIKKEANISNAQLEKKSDIFEALKSAEESLQELQKHCTLLKNIYSAYNQKFIIIKHIMVLQEQYVDLQKKKQVIDLELEKAKIIFDHALDEMKQHNIKLKQLLKSDGAMSLLREAMVYTINNDQRGNLQAIGGDDEFMDEVLPVLQVENLGHIDEKVTNSHIYGDVLKHIHNHMRDTNKILEQLKSKDERIQAIQSLSKKDIDSQNCPVQKVLLIELKNDILKKLGEIKEQELHNKILPSGIESDISMSINDTVKIGEIHRQNQNVLESFLNDIRGNNSLRYEYDEIVKLQHSNKIQNTIEINLLAKLLDEKLIAQLLYQAQQSSLSDRQQRFLENPFEWISQEQFQGNQYIGMLQQNTKWEEECNRFINENYHDTGKYYPGNE